MVRSGAVLLELYCAVRMVDGRVPPDGYYELKEHVAEIVDMFGPFSGDLLEKGNQDLVRSILDDNGMPKAAPLVNVSPLASGGFMPGLDQKARDEFASFLRAMMKINPVERFSTEDLLAHPWVGVRAQMI